MESFMRTDQGKALLLFILASISRSAGFADAYPRQNGIDAQHYVFRGFEKGRDGNFRT